MIGRGSFWRWSTLIAGVLVVAPGRRNVWVCVMGRKSTDGPFREVVKRVSESSVSGKGLAVDYSAPGVGRIRFDWEGTLAMDAREVPLRGYARWENPWCHAEFGSRVFEIQAGDKVLRLDFAAGVRSERTATR